MSEKYFRGKIVFINNDKEKATIEYVNNNKVKTISAIVNEKQQEKYIQKNLIKKSHRFLVGDHVKFIIKKSSANVFFADHIQYEYNNALEVLINKSKLQNKFLGYVKVVDEKYFIKEIDSYLFFTLTVSKYEHPPVSNENEKPVSFKLINIEKPEKLCAELYNHSYLDGFLIAIKQHKKEENIEAIVTKITAYGVFITLTESKLDCKLTINDELSDKLKSETIRIGSTLSVKIIHLTTDRIVVEYVDTVSTS
jgi:predicted RNA-binding protein (virulence factor B family)